jgi:hypothetical protein
VKSLTVVFEVRSSICTAMWEFICLDLVYGKNSMRRLVEEKVVAVMLCGRCGGSSSSYGGCNSLVTSMILAIAMEVNSVFGSKTDKLIKDLKNIIK